MSEAIKQAIAALEPFAKSFAPTQTSDVPEFQAFLDRNTVTPSMTMGDFRRAHEAFAALAALSAEQPKPFGYFHLHKYGDSDIAEQVVDSAKDDEGVFPLYASPIAAPASQPDGQCTDPAGGACKTCGTRPGLPCPNIQPDAAAIRNKALEEAIRACEGQLVPAAEDEPDSIDHAFNGATMDCIRAIRALAQAPQEQQEQDGTCVKCPRDPHKVCDYCGLQQAGQPAPAVPEGFVLVPMTENADMVNAGIKKFKGMCGGYASLGEKLSMSYRAMINAAPAQEGKTK